MPRSTPWGAAQHVEPLFRGVAAVGTASHGGLMVSSGLANKILSEPARREGLIHGGYHCYEEDCAVSVAVYDSPQIRAALYPPERLEEVGGEDELMKRLHLDLSTYFIPYLKAIGVAPDPEKLRMHEARVAFDKARKEAPETVFVCGKGEWGTLLKGVQTVQDGAGHTHYVTTASKEALRADPVRNLESKLADLEIVDPGTLPPACDRLAPYLAQKRHYCEQNGGLDNFEQVVESVKSDWFSLVRAEHGWSNEDAETYLRRSATELRAAVNGVVTDEVLGVLIA